MSLFVAHLLRQAELAGAAHGDARGALRLCRGLTAGVVRLGGPFLNDAGDMIGSLIIVEAGDLAAARAWTWPIPTSWPACSSASRSGPGRRRSGSCRKSGNPAQPPPGARLCALADIAEPGSKGSMLRDGD